MTASRVPLPLGDVGWLLPTLTDPAERNHVTRLLAAADDGLHRLGQRLGAPPDELLWHLPANRFIFVRLGHGPDFPVTILTGEGGSDPIRMDVLLTPPGPGPFHRPGPPWQTYATVFLRCDAADPGCAYSHVVDTRTGPLTQTPTAAAAEVLAATEWLAQRLSGETEASLRRHDPDRGHPPTPRRRD